MTSDWRRRIGAGRPRQASGRRAALTAAVLAAVSAAVPAATAVAAALLLAGCGGSPAPVTVPPPPLAAQRPSEPAAAAGEDPGALAAFYAKMEADLQAAGRLRRDPAPPDLPFGPDELVRDFERIALYDEYADVNGAFVHEETPAVLRRWTRPVRVGVMAGSSSLPEEAARDRANVAAFSQRLSRLTGVDIGLSDGRDVNFLVLFMNSTERLAFAEQVSARYPDFAPAVMRALRDTPLDTFCTAYAFGEPDNPGVYSAVMILIRAEHPPLTRLSCVQEEMAQAMGLPNDSPDARPSLFNDSLEFALLTEHDEILLRMLYDPRLRPGMSAAEVRPLLPAIARDAMAAAAAAGSVAALTN